VTVPLVNGKKCSRCKQIKSFDEFRKKSAASDGLDYSCKECSDKMVKKSRERSDEKERLREQRKKAKEAEKRLLDWRRSWDSTIPSEMTDEYTTVNWFMALSRIINGGNE
jgi:hypothetical protein